MSKSQSGAPSDRRRQVLVYEAPGKMALSRINFIMMAVCGLLIVVGFLLMTGGSTTSTMFNEDIFSTRRIIVGPAISFIGFVLMAFAILYRRKGGEARES